jgi:hypothetical protein
VGCAAKAMYPRVEHTVIKLVHRQVTNKGQDPGEVHGAPQLSNSTGLIHTQHSTSGLDSPRAPSDQFSFSSPSHPGSNRSLIPFHLSETRPRIPHEEVWCVDELPARE